VKQTSEPHLFVSRFSHSTDHEGGRLSGRNAGRSSPTFQRNILHQSKLRKNRQRKCLYVTFQKIEPFGKILSRNLKIRPCNPEFLEQH
jgi:hypothetical protein